MKERSNKKSFGSTAEVEIWWIDIGKSTDLIIYMSDDETKKPLALIALLSLFICGSVGIQIFDLKKYNLLTRVPSISLSKAPI